MKCPTKFPSETQGGFRICVGVGPMLGRAPSDPAVGGKSWEGPQEFKIKEKTGDFRGHVRKLHADRSPFPGELPGDQLEPSAGAGTLRSATNRV